ncbi:AfsA-related hotdog domain-containing protein [Jeongeupia naejangsanensis]|uniref:A-factor biosynthesis hotdog domain-containing protein n=1 Tax=Jeongeupia naejangsanensis TaxID=613195 RepID=A0ABS2BJQ0_9NEIS|nr:AfsA-related hotdog domain-containing protein [Jeongeupia naejangsanensis]MBM3115832.1 hypothetical protein [Jeongeupia naejangsanensis]
MNPDQIVVVGDKFAHFANLPGVMTVSQLAHKLDGAAQDEDLPTSVVIGQGVSEGWYTYLKGRFNARGVPVAFRGEEQITGRTGRRFSHKWQRRNILITDPQQTGLNQYHMLLSLDDDCEIISDHTTGHHIQGMVLTEAARQAFLAVSEWFLLPKNEKYYFVINKFNVDYTKFTFPLQVGIDFHIESLDQSRADRMSAKTKIRFVQQNETVCTAEVEYTAILESRLNPKEEQMAITALNNVLDVQASQPRQVA